jgi:hypothetical protein
MTKERRREIQHDYRLRHLARVRKRNREWARRHPERSQRWRKRNPERVFEIKLNFRYGQGASDHYKKQLKKQKGRCAICRVRMKRPELDHCHRTMRLRKLLCRSCNLGLGNFKDKAVLLRRAAKYVKESA